MSRESCDNDEIDSVESDLRALEADAATGDGSGLRASIASLATSIQGLALPIQLRRRAVSNAAPLSKVLLSIDLPEARLAAAAALELEGLVADTSLGDLADEFGGEVEDAATDFVASCERLIMALRSRQADVGE